MLQLLPGGGEWVGVGEFIGRYYSLTQYFI